MIGARTGAVTGLNLVSPTNNYLAVNDLPLGGNNTSMGMMNQPGMPTNLIGS